MSNNSEAGIAMRLVLKLGSIASRTIFNDCLRPASVPSGLVTDAYRLSKVANNSTHNRRNPPKRRARKMHNLVATVLAVAYLAANVYAIVNVGVFESALSRKHLLLYGVPFILWGSLILLGGKLMETLRRFDEWAS
jgi:hypothetical protein